MEPKWYLLTSFLCPAGSCDLTFFNYLYYQPYRLSTSSEINSLQLIHSHREWNLSSNPKHTSPNPTAEILSFCIKHLYLICVQNIKNTSNFFFWKVWQVRITHFVSVSSNTDWFPTHMHLLVNVFLTINTLAKFILTCLNKILKT